MPIVFKAIFLLSFGSMAIVYLLYYIELSAFRRMILQHHPSLMQADGGLSAAYKVMRSIKDGELDGFKLVPEANLTSLRAKKLLYAGMVLFLIVLGIGLVDSI